MVINNKKTILLVEDDAITSIATSAILQKFGYNVFTANSGKTAVEIAKNNNNIDLIIMDIDLGEGIDGTEAAGLILKDRDIPVLFLSSHTEQEIVEKTEKITSYGYVVKNTGPTVLDASVKMAFKLFNARKKAENELAGRKLAEKGLSHAKMTWEKTFNSMSDIVCMISLEHTFLAINDAGIKSFGLPKEKIIGKKCYEIFHGTNAPIENCPCIKVKASSEEEFQEYQQNGKRYILQASPMFDETGSISSIVHLIKDITEYRQTESLLQESEENFRALFENSSSPIAIIESDSIISMVNEEFCTVTGLTKNEAVGMKWPQSISPEDLDRLKEYNRKRLNNPADAPDKYECSVIKKNGEKSHIIASVKVLNSKKMILSFADITERKNMEDKIRLSEEKFSKLFHLNPSACGLSSLDDGKYIEVNKAFYNLFGFTEEEVIGKTAENLGIFSAETRKEIISNVDQNGNIYNVETELKTKNGNVRYVMLSSENITIQDKKYRFAVVHDITKRKEIEEALIQSEMKFRSLINVSPVPMALNNDLGQITLLNTAFIKTFGYTLDDIPTLKSWWPKAYPDPAYQRWVSDSWNAELEHIKKTGAAFSPVEVIVKCKNGKNKTVLASASFYKNFMENNHLIVLYDITDRKHAEEMLHESNEQFQTLAELAPVGIYLTDPEGNCLYANPAWCKMAGLTLEEALGQGWVKGLHPDDRAYIFESWNKMVESRGQWGIEYRFQNREGKITNVFGLASPQYDESGRIIRYVGVNQDITARKIDEEKIKSLLEEKELILREVNHRIKNNMSTLYGLLILQADSLKDQSGIDALEDAANRVKSMMLLYDKLYRSSDFQKISTLQYIPFLLEEIALNFPENKTIKIEKNIDDIVLDAKRMQVIGIIINELITNIMKYAFTGRDKGIISVSASLKESDIYIIIQDNGNGIPESIDFEHSTGFGLQLVWMLTKELRGSIKIERESGTKIILEFKL